MIDSIHINSESVGQMEEFQRVSIGGNELTIHPADHRFTVVEFDGHDAVLESDDEQIYQAVFVFEGDDFILKMSVPGMEEKVQIMATYSPALTPS